MLTIANKVLDSLSWPMLRKVGVSGHLLESLSENGCGVDSVDTHRPDTKMELLIIIFTSPDNIGR